MAYERNNNSIKFRDKNVTSTPKTNLRRFPVFKKWIFFMPAVAAILCYSNGLQGDFVHDDVYAIKNNPDVFGNSRISSLFQNDYWGKSMSHPKSHKSYRPLTVLTFRLNYELTGKDPFYFHLVNFLLHVTVTCLFMYTCSHVIQLTEKCSVLSASLFAVHPVHVESVTGIVGRAELLAGGFFFLSFIAYTKSITSPIHGPARTKSRCLFMSSIILATAAMLCKETGVTVLGVCVLYDVGVICKREVARLIETRRITSHCRPLLSRVAIIAVSVMLLLTFRWWIMNGELPPFQVQDNPASFHSSFLTRWLTFSFIWSYNVWLLLAPITLCYDWQTGSIPLVESVYDTRNQATLASGVIFAAIVYTALRNFKAKHIPGQRNIVYIGLMFTVIPFIPASNIFFRVGFVLAERVLYIPSLGYCLCIAGGFERLFARYRKHTNSLIILFLTVVMIFAMKTWNQNRIWESRESLFRSGIQTLPHNAKVHYNLANFMKDTHQKETAIAHYREALRLDPRYAQTHNNLGTLLERSDEAEFHFLTTLDLVPSHQGAHVNLGNHYFNQGDHEKGLYYLNKAKSFDPENPDVLTSLATCYVQTGNHTNAEELLNKVLRDRPEYKEAHISYGGLLSKLGRHAESARHYQKAYQLDMSRSTSLVHAAVEYNRLGDKHQAEVLLKQAISTHREPSALEQLAVLYYHSGRVKESEWLFDEMSRTFPNSTETLHKQAKVLANTKSFEKAEAILTSILPRDPDNADVRWTLAHVFAKQGKHVKAIEQLNKTLELAETNPRVDMFELFADRGNNYKDLGQYDLALNDYKTALEYKSSDASVHANIGAIYHLYRAFDKAEHHYRVALQLDPENELITDNLERLNRLRSHPKQNKDNG